MAVFSISGYMTLVLAISSIRKLQTNSNKLIVLLGISDILNLITSLICSYASQLTDNLTEMYCISIHIPPYFFALSSHNLFILVALDKYIRVFYPLRYEVIITKFKTVMGIVFCFFCGLIISILPLLGVNNIRTHRAMQMPWNFKYCYGFIIFRGDLLLTVHSCIAIDIVLCLFFYT